MEIKGLWRKDKPKELSKRKPLSREGKGLENSVVT
jgi:hypothetical protein